MSRKFIYLWAGSLIIHLLWMVNVGYVLPFIPHFFLLPFLLYHRSIKTRDLLLVAFGTGILLDAFAGTGGLYAAALVAFVGLQKLYDHWTADPQREKSRLPREEGLWRRSLVMLIQISVFEILFYFFDGMSATYVFFRMGHILAHGLETWLFLWIFTGLIVYKPSNA